MWGQLTVHFKLISQKPQEFIRQKSLLINDKEANVYKGK